MVDLARNIGGLRGRTHPPVLTVTAERQANPRHKVVAALLLPDHDMETSNQRAVDF